MQMFAFTAASLAILSLAAAAPRSAFADTEPRVSGPHIHENLAVYFVHGRSADGPVPLTLQEALEKGTVKVLETGAVNQLKIENTGSEGIFIQTGDIVKGGWQDRVLTMSFVLPPKSGQVSLAAFCVERGRWSARGSEDMTAFASAAEAMPSRKAKLAMMAPRKAAADEPRAAADRAQRSRSDTGARQKEVWESVAETQSNLTKVLTSSVASPESETSLQLSLENEKLKEARTAYETALLKSGEAQDDIVGYVFAVNGRLSSGDVYPSNALMRKVWRKQLAAGITEAIGAADDKRASAPSLETVSEFLAAAEKAKAQDEIVVGDLTRQQVRDADATLFVEARRSDGTWVHRAYLAKQH